jgi:hypothetical protein
LVLAKLARRSDRLGPTRPPSAGCDRSGPCAWTTCSSSMSAIWRRFWPSMWAISTTGARIVRLNNVRPAHRRHLRLIEALMLERSLQYRCVEVSIMFISGPLDVLHQILAPTPRTFSGLHANRLGTRQCNERTPCNRTAYRLDHGHRMQVR